MYHQDLLDLLKTIITSLDEAIADAESAEEHYGAFNGQLLSVDPQDPHPLSGRIVATSGMSIIIATEELLPVRAMEHITLYEEATWLLQR